ncbi:MAG: hypothetical protein DME10_08420, partial [Candidatus Rokuibacteriota bacterium]
MIGGEGRDRVAERPEAYRKTVLPGGIRVVTEALAHVRSVAVGIWVETGSRVEPVERGGISHLIEHLVFKGTETRTAEAIARTMDSVGGQMDAFTTKEHTCFYVQVLDEHLPLAVDLLTDIMGSEDHYGDMDFKVAGTDKGITALQMDIKIGGVSVDIMRQALAQAREARLHVLGKMAETIKAPRTALSEFAPRFITIRIRPEKIREIIGPGGKVIRGIQE